MYRYNRDIIIHNFRHIVMCIYGNQYRSLFQHFSIVFENISLSSGSFPHLLCHGASSSHNHHFKWWFGLALIRAGYMLAQKGGYRKRCYWSAYKAVLLESSFLDSSACSFIYFFIASSVILPIVET